MPSLAQIPLIRFIIPFILGIVSAIYIPLENQLTNYTLGVFLISYLLLLSIKKINSSYKLKWLFGVLIYLILFNLGHTITLQKSNSSKPFQLNNKQNQVMIGEVISPPLIKEKTVKTTIAIKGLKTNENWVSTNGNVIVFVQKDSLSESLKLGDYISFNPQFENVPDPKNPNEFDYKRYLSFHLIHQQSYLKSSNWKIIDNTNNNSLFLYADKFRTKLIKILEENGLKGNELGVASALILGYKNNIDAQLKNAYSSAGAMHILAVSGLHVGIIFMIFNYLLQFLEKLKYGIIIKAIIILLLMWSYAFITGLSPSVLRASTMFSFIVLAKAIKRNSNFYNTLAASAFVLLIYNPFYIMDVGFQLSYIAVIGIVIIQPWLSKFYLPKNKIIQYFWDLTTVSVAAQIATFPLGLYYFHQFPNYFFISNLVVIPFAVIILYLGLSLFIISFIPYANEFTAYILNKSIWILNASVNTINELPYSVSANVRFTFEHTILIYLVITFIVVLFISRKLKFLLISQTIIILFLIDVGFNSIEQSKQKKIMIYNIPNYSAINFIDGKDNILLSDIKLYNNKSKLLYHVKNNWIEEGVKNEKVVDLDKLKKAHLLSNIYRISNQNLFTKLNYFQFYNTKIAIIDNNLTHKKAKAPINIDLLIWTKNNSTSISEVMKSYTFKQLIIDSSNSNYTNEKLINEAKNLEIDYWSVLTQGSYSINLVL
ncbi:ComEC family competence protein [Vicingus serpentipes]|uniref:ComEC family competence protein n=1 Tax=Vicingus serpentipes TaxID=1926625 RepID=A0A5C6RUV2_9FLAO|nr:ComEC/Rec2 family competence protein [Vicingus serpentipes]TXB66138.1 ComEC family competence protein [Vicingus serpentipes]